MESRISISVEDLWSGLGLEGVRGGSCVPGRNLLFLLTAETPFRIKFGFILQYNITDRYPDFLKQS